MRRCVLRGGFTGITMYNASSARNVTSYAYAHCRHFLFAPEDPWECPLSSWNMCWNSFFFPPKGAVGRSGGGISCLSLAKRQRWVEWGCTKTIRICCCPTRPHSLKVHKMGKCFPSLLSFGDKGEAGTSKVLPVRVRQMGVVAHQVKNRL